MSDLDKRNQEQPLVIEKAQQYDFLQEICHQLLSDPLSNLPSLFFLGVAVLGVITLISTFFSSFLVFPFLLIAILASVFAMWHIRLLGSMKVQVERLTEQNTRLSIENKKFGTNNADFARKIAHFGDENKALTGNLVIMEATIDTLKANNDRLHQELGALQELRANLQSYAQESKLDFSQLLQEVNHSFAHLEQITHANERVLLQRIAQDLEFLDHQAGMQRGEYERFVRRIPEHLQAAFAELGDTSFEHIAGDDQRVDHQEIQALVKQVIDDKVS